MASRQTSGPMLIVNFQECFATPVRYSDPQEPAIAVRAIIALN
jgi:hypothetical protein